MLFVPVLLLGLPSNAVAQTATGVPKNWPLIPSGLGPGDQFRLIFYTSATRRANTSDIAVYNQFVQNQAAAGHSSIRAYSSQFKVVGSTSSVNARDNTGTTGTGVPIYWLNGDKVADDYADFYDGNWDSYNATHQGGVRYILAYSALTGTNPDGTARAGGTLGHSLISQGHIAGGKPLYAVGFNAFPSTEDSFYGLSPVFEIDPTPALTLSLDRGKDTCSVGGGSSKTYTCVKETDSAPKNVEFQVKTGQRSSSPLPFRLCFSGSATRRTGGNAEQDDWLIQERVGSSWQTRNSGCVDSSIAANQQLKRFRIQVLGDNHYEQVSMWIDGQERLVISGQETVNITLNPNPGNPLPSPYKIDSVFSFETLVIDDDDYHQQPLAFGTWAGKPGVKEGRPSLDQDVGIPFSAQAGWDNTVTYRVVRGHEDGGSTAIYGTDYRLRGDYNRNTNRGTMTLAKGKTVASLPITVIEDALVEGTETVVLEMVDTGTHEVAKPNRITIYITDDEATPLLKVDERGKVLRDGVDSGHRIKMSLTPAHSSIPERSLTVDAHFEYCVTGSATLGDDYELVRPNGTYVKTKGCHLATLPKGELSTYLDLNLFDDGNSDEPNESVKIRLQKSTVSGKETPDLLEIPDSTRTDDETISTVITIKDDLPVLAVSGRDDTSKRDRRYRAIYTIRSVNGGLPTDLYVKWQVEDTGNVVNDNRKQSLGKSGYKTLTKGDSEFTVTIGIRHDAGPGSATFKLIPADRPFRVAPGSHCVRINNGLCPVGNNAPAIQVPDTAVSNLQVTAVDDASAGVSWDAVAHATSYEVSWDGSGTQTAVSGIESVTGTTATLRHEAQEAMTLTVTVTPEYVDGNGVTQPLDALAATASLAVGQGSSEQAKQAEAQPQTPTACVADALLADVEQRIANAGSPAGTERWTRVKNALTGRANAIALTEVKDIYDNRVRNGWSTAQWDPVIEAMECLAAPQPASEPETEPEQEPVPVPDITIAGGNAITEGGTATFTLRATPAPTSALTVNVNVVDSGSFANSGQTGSRQVTLGTDGSGTLTVSTDDDSTDEPNGSISATVTGGTGYSVHSQNNSALVAVNDNDDPPPVTPVVSISGGSAITEGGTATFTLSATPAPTSALTVNVNVVDSGNFANSGQTGSRQVTLGTDGSGTLTVNTDDDSDDEADGRLTATVTGGTGYTVHSQSNSDSVTVNDDDVVVPVLRVTSEQSARATDYEGTTLRFTLHADVAPEADLDVTVNVAEPGNAFINTADAGTRQVTLPAGKRTATLRVRTDDDSVEEDTTSATVTVTVQAGSGYTVASAPRNEAEATVHDNDDLPTLSIGDSEAAEGSEVYFEVTLSKPVTHEVTFSYYTESGDYQGRHYGSADSSMDYPYTNNNATIHPGGKRFEIWIPTFDDSHDEGDETFTVILNYPEGATIDDGEATGTIKNSDPLPTAFLGRFGRGLAEQAVSGITGRLKAGRTPGFAGQFLGHAPSGGENREADNAERALALSQDRAPAFAGHGLGATGSRDLGGVGMNSRDLHGAGMTTLSASDPLSSAASASSYTPTLADALAGSAFTYTREADEAGGSFGLWGRGMHATFNGSEGALNVDGTLTTGLIGADYARADWQAGLAVLLTGGKGNFRGETGHGKLDTSMTAFVPYAAKQAGRLSLWGAAGVGLGEMTLSETLTEVHSTESLRTDMGWQMAAGGVRSDVGVFFGETGPELALVGDAQWTRTTSDKTRGLSASEAQTTRLRVGVEGGWSLTFAEQSLRPTLEAGVRYDAGDAETGLGVDVGAALSWEHTRWGLAVDIEGRTLVLHEAKRFTHSGFAASLTFDPDLASLLGPSLTLTHRLGGPSNGGMDALFGESLPGSAGNSNTGGQWQAEAAYGMALFRGRFIGAPTLGYALSGQSNDYRLGWRLTPAGVGSLPVSAEVGAMRREVVGAEADHGVTFNLRSQW